MTASASAGGIVERHEHARAGGQQVLGVEVRRRHRRAAGDDRERQRAGDDLLARAVRRQVDRRGREHRRQVLDARGSGRRRRRDRRGRGRARGARARSGTPRRAAWRPRDGSGRRSRSSAVGMPRDDRRHRRDRDLDPLARRDQAEGREHRAPCRDRRATRRPPVAARRAGSRAGVRRPGSSSDGPAVRHDADPLGRDQPRVEDHPARRLGEHAHQRRRDRTARAASRPGGPTARDRTVCSVTTIGWRSSVGEREDVRALGAAEDAVLVLDHDDVVAAALEHARRGGVVAALVLVDPGRRPRRPARRRPRARSRRGRRPRRRRRRAAPRAGRARTSRCRRRAAGTSRRCRRASSARRRFACVRSSRVPLLTGTGLLRRRAGGPE